MLVNRALSLLLVFCILAPACGSAQAESLHPLATLSTPLSNALSPQQVLAQMVGDDTQAFLGYTIKIKTYSNAAPNAYVKTDHGTRVLMISSGLVALSQTPSELAFVIAHELGHVSLHHDLPDLATGTPYRFSHSVEKELEADHFAVALLKSAGYDIRAGSSLLHRVSELGSRSGVPFERIYPSLGLRLARLDQSVSARFS